MFGVGVGSRRYSRADVESQASHRCRGAAAAAGRPPCLGDPRENVEDAARSVLALHGTDPASVYLSAWARVPGLTHADVDDALYESRTVVKHMAMRRTVWVVPTDLMPVVQSAASDLIAAAERRRLARDLQRCGVTDDAARWMRKAERAAVTALEQNGPSLGRELSDAVPMLRAKITSGPSVKAPEFGVMTRVTRSCPRRAR